MHKKQQNRRDFLKVLGSAGLLSLPPLPMLSGANQSPSAASKLIGIQVSPINFLDEGIEYCLDILEEAGMNALFCYSQNYHESYNKPTNVFADHGVPVKGFLGRSLPHLWVRTHPKFYGDTMIGHEKRDPRREYYDRDLFREILKPARQRGMKLYARILEASANRKDLIPNYEQVLTVDIFGKPGRGPCWNHPHYREWLVATVRDLVTNYELDGFQYGAERTGPLSYLLNRGLVPTCFCEHCVKRNEGLGIDPKPARDGYRELYGFIRLVEAGEVLPGRVQTGIYRYLQRFPEILSWNYQWFQADHEIHELIYRAAKEIRPELEVGRHVDHQRSSWDIWYRAAVPYGDMAASADFVKPILYHDILGPRLKHWVIEEMQQRVAHDFPEKAILEHFYAQFGHDPARMPTWEQLDERGLGAPYVYSETKRCVEELNGGAKVYAGIGVDVPWHLPEGGMAPFPSPEEELGKAIDAAFEAGADGLLISREYEEMRLESLRAIGRKLR